MMESASTVRLYSSRVATLSSTNGGTTKHDTKKAATLKVAAFCFMLDDFCRHPTAHTSSAHRGLT